MMRPRCARNGATPNLSSPEWRTRGRATALMKFATQAFRSGAESIFAAGREISTGSGAS